MTMRLVGLRFYPSKVRVDAGENGGSFALAEFGFEPLVGGLVVFGVVAAIYAVARWHAVERGCAWAVGARQGDKMLNGNGVKQANRAATVCASMTKVVETSFPLKFSQGIRQVKFSGLSLVPVYLLVRTMISASQSVAISMLEMPLAKVFGATGFVFLAINAKLFGFFYAIALSAFPYLLFVFGAIAAHTGLDFLLVILIVELAPIACSLFIFLKPLARPDGGAFAAIFSEISICTTREKISCSGLFLVAFRATHENFRHVSSSCCSCFSRRGKATGRAFRVVHEATLSHASIIP